MKAHELAKKLLAGPDLEVMFSENWGGLAAIDSCSTSKITEPQAEACGNCEGRVGESIVRLAT
jgi:hypothetical protein